MRSPTSVGGLGAASTLLVSRDVSPQVAFARNGDAILTWLQFDGPRYQGTNFRVQTRSRSAWGTIGSTTTLSSPATNMFNVRVAVADSGAGTVAWEREDGDVRSLQAAAGP
ncbi:MAG: hypothetical protein QOD83_2346 [Solirubrobacteraceae bacterium]|nr:hypothetical protein [Solirubrobacteraceae bacterium]